MDVMIDLETMSTRSDAAIVAIGAVKFDPDDKPGTFGPEFYCAVDLQSCLDAAFRVDGDTIMWWLKQSDDARNALTDIEKPKHVTDALSNFWDWYGEDSVPTWGNGSSFDLVILANAYYHWWTNPPWKFYHEKCFRTLTQEFQMVPRHRPLIAHHALEDAKAQAMTVQAVRQYKRTLECAE